MKLNRRMLFIILLIIIMAIVIYFMAAKANKSPSSAIDPDETVIISPTDAPEQQSAAAAFNSIKMEILELMENGGEPDYSPYYAGGSVDADGKLIIYLTEDTAEIREYFIALADYDDTEIEIVQYPYSLLQEVMEACNYADQEVFEETGFIVAGIDEMNNCVTIGLREVTDEKIAIFKEKVANSDCIVFEEYLAFEV